MDPRKHLLAGQVIPAHPLALDGDGRFSERHQRALTRYYLAAGVCGNTAQAVAEAELARGLGYHAGLLSLGAVRDLPEDAILAHCQQVAKTIPLIGFYLQPAVGGRVFPYEFWRKF